MRMRLFLGMTVLFFWACSPVREVSRTSAILTQSSQDSTEYEVIINDPDFDQWYIINYSPAKDYSDEYYRGKNLVAVVNWNEYYRTGKYSGFIECYLDYRPDIDYGIEVNRKLFWYFKYLQETFKIRLYT